MIARLLIWMFAGLLFAALLRFVRQRLLRPRNQTVTGKVTDLHPNGRMKLEKHLRDGVLHGPWISWDEQGNKTGEGAFDRGMVHGTEIDYGTGGIKQREVPWIGGRRHGTAKAYDAEGKVTKLLCYVHDETDKPRHEGACSAQELKTPPPE